MVVGCTGGHAMRDSCALRTDVQARGNSRARLSLEFVRGWRTGLSDATSGRRSGGSRVSSLRAAVSHPSREATMSMWKEFKGFLIKENVLALAIAVVIGGALNKLVT